MPIEWTQLNPTIGAAIDVATNHGVWPGTITESAHGQFVITFGPDYTVDMRHTAGEIGDHPDWSALPGPRDGVWTLEGVTVNIGVKSYSTNVVGQTTAVVGPGDPFIVVLATSLRFPVAAS